MDGTDALRARIDAHDRGRQRDVEQLPFQIHLPRALPHAFGTPTFHLNAESQGFTEPEQKDAILPVSPPRHIGDAGDPDLTGPTRAEPESGDVRAGVLSHHLRGRRPIAWRP